MFLEDLDNISINADNVPPSFLFAMHTPKGVPTPPSGPHLRRFPKSHPTGPEAGNLKRPRLTKLDGTVKTYAAGILRGPESLLQGCQHLLFIIIPAYSGPTLHRQSSNGR